MGAIYRRELKSYFTNMIAYIFIAFLLVVVGIFFTYYNLKQGAPQLEYALYGVMFIFLVTVPLLTMRSIASEKYDRTEQLLYSLPLNMKSIVMGKFLAMFTVFAIPMALICFYPFILSIYGSVNFIGTYSSILAYILLGAALISIGMFISSLTESQVIAAVVGLGALLLIYLMPDLSALIPTTEIVSYVCFAVLIALFAVVLYSMTKNSGVACIAGAVLEAGLLVLFLFKKDIFASAFPDMLKKIALFERFTEFVNGTFDLTGIIYYVSVIFVFIFLTVQSLEKKRYS